MEHSPTSEPNLALDRQEAVKQHNDLLKDYENLPEDDKKYVEREGKMSMTLEAESKFNEMSTLRRQVENIDAYRKMAVPGEGKEYEAGDISNIEKLQAEKTRTDEAVEKVKKDIQNATEDLNKLRAKLGMAPSDDIPALSQKKKKPWGTYGATVCFVSKAEF